MVRRVGVPDGAWAVEAELTDGAPWSYFVVPIRDSETGAMLAFVGLAAADGAFEQLHLLRHPAALQFVDPDAAAAAARTAFGAEIISDGLLRLSVGIEHADDLLADIGAALDRALSCQDKRKAAP